MKINNFERVHDVVFEHNNGTCIKLAQVYYITKFGDKTWKWVISWKAPNTLEWNVVNEFTKRTKNAHRLQFDEMIKALEFITIETRKPRKQLI